MKSIFGLLLMIGLFGCEAITAANQRPFVDIKLIGVWKGEYTERGGTIKRWTQTRSADGTYAIEFSFIELDGVMKSFTESGRWWIMNGLFHEIALPDMGQPDKYQYSFKERECVNFVLVESDGFTEDTDSADNYVFKECLVADSPPVIIGESI